MLFEGMLDFDEDFLAGIRMHYVSKFTVSYFLILRGSLVVEVDRRSTPNTGQLSALVKCTSRLEGNN